MRQERTRFLHMKKTKNINFVSKPDSRLLKKNGERARLKKLVSGLNKNSKSLRKMVGQQTNELIEKDLQLKQGADKQERSEEQVHIRTKAMESVSDGIFIIDAQKPFFPVIYANLSFQMMTGFSQREIMGKNYFLLYGVEADHRIVEEIRHTLLHGKSFHGEMLNFRKTGEKYWNLLRISPVRDVLGAITHYVGIQTDVTLMRQRDLELKEQREELLHVTRVGKLAEFVSSLAHEISQPLTAILAYAQASQRMLKDREPEVRENLQYIIDDEQRAGEVIRRLRSLLKKIEPEMKPLDVNVLVGQTVGLVSADAVIRSNILKTELAADLPLIRGDRIQLQQVLLNLVSNSFDAMEVGQGFREVLITTSLKSENTILVEVKDSGCGIPAQDMNKLFMHFFTSKADGLGMGLSISRSIVEAHGGRLEVKNNPDRGATFYFTLPAIV